MLKLSLQQKQEYMGEALHQAQIAYESNEVPVGCIFVKDQNGVFRVIASSYNKTNQQHNASRHCEINCLLQMQLTMSSQQISQCILFVTVQPCIMCTHALNLMGIKYVCFGQYNDRFGGCGSLKKYNIFECQGGILEKESLQIIKKFYERGNVNLPEQLRTKKRLKLSNNQPIQPK